MKGAVAMADYGDNWDGQSVTSDWATSKRSTGRPYSPPVDKGVGFSGNSSRETTTWSQQPQDKNAIYSRRTGIRGPLGKE